jgi:hypothetical protein
MPAFGPIAAPDVYGARPQLAEANTAFQAHLLARHRADVVQTAETFPDRKHAFVAGIFALVLRAI